ncbi:MAG: hypothetical protein QXI97_03655 [Nitrososphaerota archaeon]
MRGIAPHHSLQSRLWTLGYWFQDIIVDGVLVRGDQRRAGGHATAAMRLDPVTGKMCLTDLPKWRCCL